MNYLVSLLILSFSVCSAFELTPTKESGFYTNLQTGVNWVDLPQAEQLRTIPDTNEEVAIGISAKAGTGTYVGAVVGHRWGRARVELEGALRHNPIDRMDFTFSHEHFDEDLIYGVSKGKFRSHSLMANAIMDLPVTFCQPYLGLGLGYSESKLSGRFIELPIDFKETGLCYQAFGGAQVQITQSTQLGLGYKYFSHFQDAPNHSLSLSISYSL